MQRRTRSAIAAAAASEAAAALARVEARRFNFISCLILTAQNGFGRDVDPFVLCRETWGEEILFDALKDLPHGRARQEGPAVQGATESFGFDHGPFSARRTRVMHAAQAGNVARLRWLLARGARLELQDWSGRTALMWASWMGRLGAVRELLTWGAAVDAAENDGATPLFAASQNNHLKVVRKLLARGAAVDAAMKWGGAARRARGGAPHVFAICGYGLPAGHLLPRAQSG
jgi:hypothetical protein